MKSSIALLLLSLACASAPPPASPAPAPPPGCAEGGGDGEEGGVEGSVVSGDGPRFLPPSVGRALVSADLKDPRYRAQLPPEYTKPGATYWALFKVCVSDAGKVTEVSTLRSSCVPQIDDAWTAMLKTWPFRPYEVNGSPHSFCYPQRMQRRIPQPATSEPAK